MVKNQTECENMDYETDIYALGYIPFQFENEKLSLLARLVPSTVRAGFSGQVCFDQLNQFDSNSILSYGPGSWISVAQ